MALDPCPYCNKTFDHDNAGARENHVNSCREDFEKFAGSEPAMRDNARGQQPGEAVPATVDESAGAVPALAGAAGGTEVGREIAKLRNAGPEEKAQLKGGLLQQLGQIVAGYGEEITAQELQEIERARGGGVAEQSEDWVECGVCDRAIQRVPATGTEFECPHCHAIIVAP